MSNDYFIGFITIFTAVISIMLMGNRAFVFLLCIFLSVFTKIDAQEQKYDFYSVGFYNIENLFDTIHDAGKNDYEFLPDGVNRWGTLKYTNKIKNIAQVLSEMGTDVSPVGMAVVGVSEVENSRVLCDLVNDESLALRGWRFIHIEGPDSRGIDCALLYNPKLFTPTSSKLVPYGFENSNTVYKTRGFLVVSGTMCSETVHIIVNHWPSRNSKSQSREHAGIVVRQLKDSLMSTVPGSKVIVMGDMNDNPGDVSMSVSLGALCEKEKVKQSFDLYNPCMKLHKEGKGTLKYEGKWNFYDQIVLSGNMLSDERSTLKFYDVEVFSRDYLFQHKGRFKGSIKRTHAAGVWLNGYSDHLPVIVHLLKKAR